MSLTEDNNGNTLFSWYFYFLENLSPSILDYIKYLLKRGIGYSFYCNKFETYITRFSLQFSSINFIDIVKTIYFIYGFVS